ncbi:MAG: methyltransferase domain-containing protein [Prevotella sp.]|jgi:tRNA1Val (adenine37-N6)-methyltransferase|nr:methyltransferase domain-containing protein [Prevotella sp.]
MTAFRFKKFVIEQELCAMKVGTDGVLLGSWATGGARVLDVGTGTGIMALMLAQRCPEARVTAIDIDEGAVRQAIQNVAQSPFNDRVEVLRCSVQEFDGRDGSNGRDGANGLYDAIVSNPPFFIDSLQTPDRQRTVARHAETLTYAQLMQAAWRLLADGGELSVVVPFDYRQRMEDEATFVGFFPSRLCAVRTAAHKPAKRFLLAFRKHPCPCERTEMTLGDETCTLLTREFYL